MTAVDEQLPPIPTAGPPELTSREFEVLFYMSHGAPNRVIGKQLYLTEDTVKTHARRLFNKLKAADRAHAVRRGFELGLLRPAVDEVPMAVERPANGGMRRDDSRLPAVDWQEEERRRITELRSPRPISVKHIAACDAAQSCPCRTTSTWQWPKGQVFADPVPMPEVQQP